jgi:hypothetical protein
MYFPVSTPLRIVAHLQVILSVLSFWPFTFGPFAITQKTLSALVSIFSRLSDLELDEAEIKQNTTAPPFGLSLSENHSAIYKASYQQRTMADIWLLATSFHLCGPCVFQRFVYPRRAKCLCSFHRNSRPPCLTLCTNKARVMSKTDMTEIGRKPS